MGGVGGSGGLTLGHDASGGLGMGPPQPPPPPPSGSHATGTSGGTSFGSSIIDVFDKTQRLTLNKARSVAHLPITAVDLYSVMPTVALFPPATTSSSETDDGDDNHESTTTTTTSSRPIFLGKMKPRIVFQASEQSHKTLRKYLTQTKPYSALKQDSLAAVASVNNKSHDDDGGGGGGDNENNSHVVLDRPHLWLGVRRVEHFPKLWQAQYTIDTKAESTPIAFERGTETGTLITDCWWANSTLDGSLPNSQKVDFDMDRVVAKLRLHTTKKALTILPEEATQLLFHQARSHVATSKHYNKTYDTNKKDEITSFPLSVAVPSWVMHDAAMEALYEAGGGVDANTPVVLFPRPVCALMGSWIKPSPKPAQNKFLQRLAFVQQALLQQHKLHSHHSKERFVGQTMVVLVGMTPQGLEAMAIQCSYPTDNAGVSHQLFCFEEFQILANVSDILEQNDKDDEKNNKNPKMDTNLSAATLLPWCLEELERVLEVVAPDSDGPAAVLTFGTTHEQEELVSAFQNSQQKESGWLSKVPWIASSVEAIATGAAMLGGMALGRITDNEGKLAIRLHSIATVATAMACYYFDPQQPETLASPVKVIFDFDRRLPAGPYAIEFKASECVVHRQRLSASKGGSNNNGNDNNGANISFHEDEAFFKAVKEAESSRNIPARETAALQFSVQVFQKYTRRGEWQPVGNPLWPLVKLDTQIDAATGKDLPETRIACESVTWELSMAVTGLLSSNWAGERESVVQAVKSARGKKMEYYGWTAFCLLFFGGFFVKSYWEDHVWKRDTQRLLDYYRHVIPNSTQDGDYDTASWLAYKYRHNKAKLWKNLETKYGVPVPDAWDEVAKAELTKLKEPQEINLDDDDDDDRNPKNPKLKKKPKKNETTAQSPSESEQEPHQTTTKENADELPLEEKQFVDPAATATAEPDQEQQQQQQKDNGKDTPDL